MIKKFENALKQLEVLVTLMGRKPRDNYSKRREKKRSCMRNTGGRWKI